MTLAPRRACSHARSLTWVSAPARVSHVVTSISENSLHRRSWTGSLPSRRQEEHPQRVEDDVDVTQDDRALAQVADVQVQLLSRRRVVPPAYLRQARDAGLDCGTQDELRMLSFDGPREFRTLGARSHDTHLPAQDVDELRHLVQSRLAEEASHRA